LLPPICFLVISVIADVLTHRGLQRRLKEERKRRAEAES
jgi:membrane protein implicated in regulation of membrane protease activity